MSCFLSILVPPNCCSPSLPSRTESKNLHHLSCTPKQLPCTSTNLTAIPDSKTKLLGAAAAVVVGGALSAVVQPAITVTGVNFEEDLGWTLIQSAISAALYFVIFPPIILNWLRIRWYRRNLVEMYLQFMCVFLFYPGVLVWDPSMKYPWSTPENPSQIKGGFLKYPWAKPEDYD